MNTVFKFFILFYLLAYGTVAHSQNCNCTISDVENNSVNPCDIIIGKIDTVTTTSELRTAMSLANDSGGNRTILIADGTYQIASTVSYPYITASNVVFRSLSGNRDAVVLRGEGMKSVDPLVESGFYIVGNNVTIADLTIKEVGNHGIAGHGDNLFVHNVKIQNTFEQMIKGTSAGDGADNGRVQCSLFEYTAGVGPQFYIGGLDIHEGNGWVVNDNIFKNIASPSVSLAEHAVHFWSASADNTVERNLIINCDRGVGFGLGSSPNEGGIIRNNMIYNDGTGIFNDVGIGLETSPNTKVYNNTIYIEYPNAIEYRFSRTTNVEISNNLTNQSIQSRDGGQAELKTNFTNALENWFVELSAGNLRLNSNNVSVVDQGTTLAEVTMDFDQTPRAQGNQFDLGAHEFVQTTSTSDIENTISNISVFPNPTPHSFTIKSNTASISNIIVYNLMGELVTTLELGNSQSTYVIDTNEWVAGIYFCKVLDSNEHQSLVNVIVSK